eukprot:7965224-Pyramimonas_sp.AAC.1
MNYIVEQYTEMRREKSDANFAEKTLPVTARALETMIRLSTAHAKLRQSPKVTVEDAEMALNVMKYAIYADEKKKMDEAHQAEADAEAAEAAAANGGDDNDEGGDAGGSRRRPRG